MYSGYSKETLRQRELQLSVLSAESLRENFFLGGITLPLKDFNLSKETVKWYQLTAATYFWASEFLSFGSRIVINMYVRKHARAHTHTWELYIVFLYLDRNYKVNVLAFQHMCWTNSHITNFYEFVEAIAVLKSLCRTLQTLNLIYNKSAKDLVNNLIPSWVIQSNSFSLVFFSLFLIYTQYVCFPVCTFYSLYHCACLQRPKERKGADVTVKCSCYSQGRKAKHKL